MNQTMVYTVVYTLTGVIITHERDSIIGITTTTTTTTNLTLLLIF